MAEVEFRINGRAVSAEEGTYLIEVAEREGISIPTLCYNKILEPYGVCRVCSVLMKKGKRERIVTACNFPVSAGIEIFTEHERALKTRRMVLELMLARHPKVKVVQDLAREYGITQSRFIKGDEGCILCGLCVRACEEVVGKSVIGFINRGPDRKINLPFDLTSDQCIGCGACATVCPTGYIRVEDVEDRQIVFSDTSLGPSTPIFTPTRQSVPNVPVIDTETCIHFQTDGCRVCERFCEHEAVDHEMADETVELEAGAIIITTGYDLLDPELLPTYGYGRYANVLTGMEFERLSNASGPTGGQILMANGKPPQSVAILHCIGSRDENYCEYCSRVCCMYALKFAHLIKDKVGADVYNFYIDLRCFGKGYEEFYHRLLEEGVKFIRGKATYVTDRAISPEEKGKLVVIGEDTIIGKLLRVPVDMVILAQAMVPSADAEDVAKIFALPRGKDGFLLEKHPKLGPVETPSDGIFIAGTAQGPKDIPDTVAQALGAASESLSLISRKKVPIEPITAEVDPDMCVGCRICLTLCPFSAIEFDERRNISVVTESVCKGCGTCQASCPSGAIRAKHFTAKQMFSEIEGLLTA
jgi:heterodisulfide reductase subunit A